MECNRAAIFLFIFRRFPWRLGVFVVLILGAWLHVLGGARSNAAQAQAGERWQPGEVLVRLRSDGSVRLFRFSPDVDVATVMSEYQRHPAVASVSLNYRVTASAFPNDPDYAKQWYLAAIAARDAWSDELLAEEQMQIKAPIIAILDTGVDVDHPDLRDKIWINPLERRGDGLDNDRNGFIDDWQGWDFVSNTSDPFPKFDPGYHVEAIHHGTVVAGIAAASSNNSVGVSGVSWQAKILPLRVLDAEGNGTVYNVVQAVEYAVAQKADVINLSFVGVDYSPVLYDTLKSAAANGAIVVAAAGNTADGKPGKDLTASPAYPICLDAEDAENFIIGVASVNQQRQLSTFSNYGKGCVDLVAPGVDMYGLLMHDSSRAGFAQLFGGSWAGTSVATPQVSGAAAIVRSLRPALSARAVRDIILTSFDDVSVVNPKFVGQMGVGQLNLSKVVSQTVGYRGPVAPAGPISGMVVTGLGVGSFPQVKVWTSKFAELKSFFAYAPTYRGEVNIAAGDVTGDGSSDIVTGTGPGINPHVRIFNRDGHVLGQFFAFSQLKRVGVNVAVGKLDAAGPARIIVAPAGGAPPTVVIYSATGERISSWYAYAPTFMGGVRVAVGDIDGDGLDEVITGAGPGGGPQIRIFSGTGELKAQFFAFNAMSRLGVNVAVGDVNNDHQDEIITSLPKGGMPMVRVFGYDGMKILALNEFYAYDPGNLLGVNLAAGDVNGDGLDEIIVGPGAGGSPVVRMFDARGVMRGEFLAHDKSYRGGVRVGFMR